MTVVLEKHIKETDAIEGLINYINSFDPELFVTQQFSTQPDADFHVVEIRLSTLKQIADRMSI